MPTRPASVTLISWPSGKSGFCCGARPRALRRDGIRSQIGAREHEGGGNQVKHVIDGLLFVLIAVAFTVLAVIALALH